ncbi:hypothetical protein [Solidesulfovibrio sp.]
MITKCDLRYVERLAPVAQLLELLGDKYVFEGEKAGPLVRDSDVLETAGRELWEIFFYLRDRLGDEINRKDASGYSDDYFEETAALARELSA